MRLAATDGLAVPFFYRIIVQRISWASEKNQLVTVTVQLFTLFTFGNIRYYVLRIIYMLASTESVPWPWQVLIFFGSSWDSLNNDSIGKMAQLTRPWQQASLSVYLTRAILNGSRKKGLRRCGFIAYAGTWIANLQVGRPLTKSARGAHLSWRWYCEQKKTKI